jgi:hypothetical protein
MNYTSQLNVHYMTKKGKIYINMIKVLNSFTNFRSLTDEEKFKFLMSGNDGDTEVIDLVLKYINDIIAIRDGHTI